MLTWKDYAIVSIQTCAITCCAVGALCAIMFGVGLVLYSAGMR